MADVPFLGCKISLISKCDIRYEGILYCVDPKESTIALSRVKSYGTETRGDNFVPPKNDVYDIIIFRASDVKDLRVDAPEPPGLSDPAIISARQSNTAFDVNKGSLPTSSGPSQQQQQQAQHKPLLPFLPTGSNNRDNAPRPRGERGSPRPRADREPTRPRADRDSARPRNDRDTARPRNDRESPRPRADRDTARPRGEREPARTRGDRGRPMRTSRGGYQDRRDNHMNSNSRFNNTVSNSRRGNSNRDDSKGGYRRGPPPGSRGGRSGDRIGAPRGARKSAPLKFEGEYDFDEANKQFLELEGKLKGMKLKDGDEKEGGESSGERANSKSPGDNSESGSGYDSEDNNKDGDSKNGESVSGEYYDKTKSFFDNISCEASERGPGKVNRPDWKKERQINAETFGVSANYRRGGYRGRSYGANGYHRR